MMSGRGPLHIRFDAILLFSTISLIIIGILFIHSSGVNSQGVQTSSEYIRQIVWAVIGVVLMLGVSLIKYDFWRDISPFIYGALFLLILFTLVKGSVVNGARSWLGIGGLGIQPSEFMKISLILMTAVYLEKRSQRDIQSIQGLSLGFIWTIPPMLLVLLQPDLGTAMVYMPIALFMLYAAGARPLYLLFILGVILATAIFAVLPEWERLIYPGTIEFFVIFNDSLYFFIVAAALLLSIIVSVVGFLYLKKPLLFGIAYSFTIILLGFLLARGARSFLKEYQMMRLIVFLDPYVDPRGAGWNIIQSLTAVGSGGFSGKGYLAGTQSHLQYLPQQSTDFIFSILSEEWGFIGGGIVSALYIAIIVRGIVIAYQAKDRLGSLIAVGVVAMIFFHFVVNVGMAIGMMPITGIPLLFLSYGGSSLWTAMIGVGLLMSVCNHRYRF